MEQTETYGLNKPGPDDPLSPAPLNENADKLEAALAALTARVKTLEAVRYKRGTYTGTGSSQTVSVGFTPSAVLVSEARLAGECTLAVTGSPATDNNGKVSIVSGGFQLSFLSLNTKNTTYHYVALR